MKAFTFDPRCCAKVANAPPCFYPFFFFFFFILFLLFCFSSFVFSCKFSSAKTRREFEIGN
jgi:hypothetical protein